MLSVLLQRMLCLCRKDTTDHRYRPETEGPFPGSPSRAGFVSDRAIELGRVKRHYR
jgi:hypothetical protein